MEYRLGLDIGTNSIGWALWEIRGGELVDLIDMGVRIFSDGCDPKSGESLAVKRRNTRRARQLLKRHKKRQHSLRIQLQKYNLLPSERDEFKNLLDKTDPYELRYQALRRELTPLELGRTLYHIGQRRGFKSNKKIAETDNSKDSKEDKESLKGIGKLKEEMVRFGESLSLKREVTIGEFLFLKKRDGQRIRFSKRSPWHANREMYEAEWEAIHNAQMAFNSDLKKIPWDFLQKCVFYQRPLQPQELGKCDYYPDETRAYKAFPSYQNFRILEMLQKLEYQTPDQKTHLSRKEKQKIYNLLQRQKSIGFRKIVSLLSLPSSGKFNFESEKRKGITGNETSFLMTVKPGLLKDCWHTFSAEDQDQLIGWFLSPLEEERRKAREWLGSRGVASETCREVMKLNLSTGVSNHSGRALRELNIRMLDHNENYRDARKSLGIYHTSHPPQGDHKFLPYYGKILSQSCIAVKERRDMNIDPEEKEFGKINNPRIHITLRQLQKVINAIIERYGIPSSISIEVERELKSSRSERSVMERYYVAEQKKNDHINTIYREHGYGYYASRSDRQKYKLWQDLDQEGLHNCLYCGKPITLSQIFSEKTIIDHILPFSETLDDSMANKTVVHRHCKQEKGNRTPYEAFSTNKQRWSAINLRLLANKNMRSGKRLRFTEDALTGYQDKRRFMERYGKDTAYISRIIHLYLSAICPQKQIHVSPGLLTAIIRGSYNLNRLLNNGNSRSERIWRKNTADHRYHALDALVIGVLSPSYLEKMVALNSRSDRLQTLAIDEKIQLLTPPLPVRRDKIETMLDNMVISFRQNHDDNGLFFNETAMGISYKERSVPISALKEDDYVIDAHSLNGKSKLKQQNSEKKTVTVRDFYWTTRIELRNLKENAIRRIFNDTTRGKFEAIKEQPGRWNEKLSHFCAANNQRRIKVITQSQKAVPLPLAYPLMALDAKSAALRKKPVQKGYAPGEFCMCIIWRLPDGKLVPHYYTYCEMRLTKMKKQEIYKPHPAAKNILRVYKQDVLLLRPKNGNEPYYIKVAGFGTAKNQIDIQPLYAVTNHSKWWQQTNSKRVKWKYMNKGTQNYKAITTLFKENIIKKTSFDVLGKPRKK